MRIMQLILNKNLSEKKSPKFSQTVYKETVDWNSLLGEFSNFMSKGVLNPDR